MRTKLLPIMVGLAICVVVSLAGIATARTPAQTRVTIIAQGRDLSGYVSSTKPRRCANGRKVTLYKQRGRMQDPTVDQNVANDMASLNGGRYQWSTGNTGLRGRFYARVRRIPGCKGDTSKTVRTT